MKSFLRFSFASTLGAYAVIFIGGLVRVSGAGLGCPDWPKCFGRWIPPTSLDQLPSHIDPASFNMVLAWIEYVNRLCGALLGVLIATTAVLAIIYFRNERRILWPSVAAALLVAFIGWQGSVVVATELRPVIVSVHLVLALLMTSLLIYATLQAYYIVEPMARETKAIPVKYQRWLQLLWLIAIIQVILGTQIRQVIETLLAASPLLPIPKLLSEVGALNYVHSFLGIILTLKSWFIGYRIIGICGIKSSLAGYSALAMIVLVSAQLLLGIGFMIFDLRAQAQLYHLWIGSLYVGSLLVLYSAGKFSREG